MLLENYLELRDEMLVIDLKYAGKYVAVSENNNTIAFSESKEELLRLLKEKGYKKDEFSVIYTKKHSRK